MAKLQVMTLDNLSLYDELIKGYVDTADAKSLKTVAISGNTLKFYKISEPVEDSTPAYTITLPETDISGLIAKMTGATAGNVVIANADGTVADGGVALADLATKAEVEAVDDKVDANATAIGTLADLDTTAKTDLVNAINEVRAAVDAGGTGSQVTIDSSVAEEGMVKSYVFKQGETTIGTVNVPLDLVVSGGSVVTNPDGQTEGTYIELIIANQEDPIYINVADLVDAYTAQASAAQIQLAISATNEISATIVAGSVTASELAADAVTTVKIADGNVTLAKLATDVTDTLTQVGTNKTNIEALQTLIGEGYEAIPEADIRGLFA